MHLRLSGLSLQKNPFELEFLDDAKVGDRVAIHDSASLAAR